MALSPKETRMTTSHTALSVDIGGTNIRFGLLEQGQPCPAHIQSYPIDHFPDLAAVMRQYLDSIPGHAVSEACIDVATPVTGDRIKLTNHGWNFSITETRRQFGFQRLKVINDFTALALSLPLLEPRELIRIGGGEPDPDGNIALLGAGTGLGVSGLVRTSDGDYPVSGEGGHVTLGARNARELAIFQAFWDKYGHMSAERLLSGTGLGEFYQAICHLDGQPVEALTPAEISVRALDGSCPRCLEVMNLFCEWLGIMASNLVLTLWATGGVYIGGGIIPKLGDFFLNSGFRSALETKGRFRSQLRSVPAYVIMADQPALRGAARALHPNYEKLGLTRRA